MRYAESKRLAHLHSRPMRSTISQAVFFACLTIGLAVSHHQAMAQSSASQNAVTRYDIPAGTLDQVLNRFATDTGILITIDGTLTAGKRSAGLAGNFDVQQGLARLLAGSGLQAVNNGNNQYTLRVSAAQSQVTELAPINVTAPLSSVDLSESYAGGQIARGGNLGTLGSVDIMDSPFNTTNYTAQILEDQQARTLADIVVNEPSVRVMTSTGSYSEDFQIRGFNVNSQDASLNGLYGLTSPHRMPAAMMERVEVLKGPATLMYGVNPSGNIGGNINIVTKRAGDAPLTRLTTSYESASILSAHLDTSRRFGEDKEWGIRFNGVYRNGDTSIDNGKQKYGLGALALDYRNAKLRWTLDTYAQREKIDTFRGQIGFTPAITAIPAAPSGRRALYGGAKLESEDTAIATRLEYDISDRLTVYAAAGYRDGNSEQDFPSARGADAVDELGNFRVSNAWYDSYSRNKTAEVGARAKFDTYGIKHIMSLSASYLSTETGYFYLDGTAINSNIYNPVPIIAMTGNRLSPTKGAETELSSVALTDTMAFANNKVLLTAGLRLQNVKTDSFNATGAVTSSFNVNAITPVAGIVVRPWEKVSLYGNFTAGLDKGYMAPSYAENAGQVFAPYKSKQYEAGVKVDWDNIITTLSVFQVSQAHQITTTNPVTSGEIYSMDGEQRNRGVEFSAVGEVTRGLRLMTGAVIYDAKLQRTSNGQYDGKKVAGVPKYNLNLGVDWDVPSLQGLSLNARAIHTAAVPNDASNKLDFPSWTRVDIGARYRTTALGKPVTFRASIDNLFNKNYWLSSTSLLPVATAAAPRTVLLSAQIDF